MSTIEPTEHDVEYVRLLRIAVDALATARMSREGKSGVLWRPAFADLIVLDTLGSQAAGEPDSDWWATGSVDEAMTRIVAAGRYIEAVPEGAWEYIDEDIQNALEQVERLAREDDEVCGGCGKRWPEGTGEVIECDNEGCPGTCPACQDEPCPKAVQA